jgi:hypothetical protein
MISAISLQKIGSGTHGVTGRRGEGVSYIDARTKQVREPRSGLHPSEKELPERHSVAFRHKNTPGDNHLRVYTASQPRGYSQHVHRRQNLKSQTANLKV